MRRSKRIEISHARPCVRTMLHSNADQRSVIFNLVVRGQLRTAWTAWTSIPFRGLVNFAKRYLSPRLRRLEQPCGVVIHKLLEYFIGSMKALTSRATRNIGAEREPGLC